MSKWILQSNLKRMRAEVGLERKEDIYKISEIAKETGVNRTTVTIIDKGDPQELRKRNMDNYFKIAEFLDIPVWKIPGEDKWLLELIPVQE